MNKSRTNIFQAWFSSQSLSPGGNQEWWTHLRSIDQNGPKLSLNPDRFSGGEVND
jgi:hypothetical protein